MTRAKHETLLKPKQIAVSVAACFALHAAQLQANPTAPSVAFGNVGFSGLGTGSLTITNQASGNAIINWNGFSIGVNELTKFQQFANLAVLNRVTGSELSSILGALQSDGRIFLINPNGIIFGANSRIDTAGLVASSLGLSNQDFLANRLRFTEVPGAGAVVNNGVIQTAAGGRVYMVAPTVENNGLIQSPQGAIVLAAGREIELVDANSPFVTVKLAAATDSAVNVGSIVADSGRIGMFGTLVRNTGNIAANSAVAGPGGEIRLVASKDLTLDAGSTVTANGASGGKVLLQAEGGTNIVAGTVEAKGSAGNGGEVQALGVRVGVVGHGVIDASGDTGGGTVLVGGDYQGKNAAVQNAESTSIGSDGVIRANAMSTGDGGRVIVWADGDTRVAGSISARGGAESGNGGFVETSGKQSLSIAGSRIDTRAPMGRAGGWFLDPTNYTIDSAQAASIESNFGLNGLVTVSADVDVHFQNGLNLSYGSNQGSFLAYAGNNINLNSFNISAGGVYGASIELSANDSRAALPSGTGAITSSVGGGNITTNGGSLTAIGNSVGLGNINTSGGTSGGGLVNVQGTVGGVSVGTVTTGGGQFGGASVNLSSVGDLSAGSINTVGGAYGGSYVNLYSSDGNVGTGSISTGGGGVYVNANLGAVSVGGEINTSNPLTSGFQGNGNVSISAYGNITTQSITTRSLHPNNGRGGDVTIVTDSGVITVNGNIDTRGADGVDDGFFSSQYYGGTSAGDVALGRSALDGFAGNAITVNGNILASGGNGLTSFSDFVSPDLSGGDGGFVSLGGNCDGPCIYGPADGNFVVTGVISTVGGNGGTSLGNADASSYGGQGGQVFLWTTGSALVGAIDARGGSAGNGANGFNGNNGGTGGQVEISSGGGVTVGWIDASGGAGGAGGDISFASADGGDGGDGGTIQIAGDSSVVVGTAVSRGGNAGAGGSASSLGYGARGGDGGRGGFINLNSSYGQVSAIAIDTSGGAGGNGGFAYGGNASGNDGGDGGSVFLQGASGVSVTSIVTRGGNGSSGGTASGNNRAEGDDGGDGGQVSIDSAFGSINVGSVDSSGGAGGAGGLADYVSFGATDASGGDGGEAGSMNFNAGTSISIGSIMARGGAGATGGVASGGDPLLLVFTDAQGGDGGDGFAIAVNAQGPLTIGSIDASGGQGAAGGVSMFASGGSGGNSAFFVRLFSASSISAGAIKSRGGDGGAGGIAQTDAGNSSGGSGGWGGSVYVQTGGGTGAPITTGMVDVSAGNGGNSGAIGTSSSTGGSGGNGGFVSYYGSTIDVRGPIFARGGNGGGMVNSSILALSGTPDGGAGGSGGSVNVLGTDKVKINVGGTLGAIAIDVRGGMGGSGHAAASPAGNGGAGGAGGFVDVVGTPDMTLFGSVIASGGAGGAGGAGNATNPGGNGGIGGNAGAIFLDASSLTSSQTGDGIIFVVAGTQFNVQGGAGGVGGADGGAGAGTGGAAGSTSTFISMTDYFGTIVILDPLSIPEVNSIFQTTLVASDESTVFVGGEDEKKDEDKSKKEFASCKG